MPTVVSQGSTRYSALVTHVLLACFGAWCLGRLACATTVEVCTKPGTRHDGLVAVVVVGFVSIAVGVCAVFGGSNDIEGYGDGGASANRGSSTTSTGIHAVLGYAFVVVLAASVTVRKRLPDCMLPSHGFVSTAFLSLCIVGWDSWVGGCGDRFVVETNNLQPVYAVNSPSFCLAHYQYEIQCLLFFLLAAVSGQYASQAAVVFAGEHDRLRMRNTLLSTECLLVFFFGCANLVCYGIANQLVDALTNPRLEQADRLPLDGAGIVGVLFVGLSAPGLILTFCLHGSSSQESGEVQRHAARLFRWNKAGTALSYLGCGVVLMMQLAYSKTRAYFYQEISYDSAIGAIQEMGLSLGGINACLLGLLKVSAVLYPNAKHGPWHWWVGSVCAYATGLGVLLSQPIAASHVYKMLGRRTALQWAGSIYLLSVFFTMQDPVLVWLLHKLKQSMGGGRPRAGRFLQLPTQDRHSEDEEEEAEGDEGSVEEEHP